MTATQEPQTLDIPGLLGKLAEFCDLSSDHVNLATGAVSIGLQYGREPRLHLKARGNAAKAVLFALDILDEVRVTVCQHETSRQVYVNGLFEGVPFELVACSADYDTSVIDSYVDWETADWLGFVTVSVEDLRAMAAHEVAEVSVPQ